MASAVDICNLAYAYLGDEAAISSLSPPDGSVQAQKAAIFYPIARNAILERYPWSFATKRQVLNTIENPDQPPSWAFTYALPTGCIRPLKVLPAGYALDSQSVLYETETLQDGTKVIYTNAADATLVYIAGITDTTKFSPLFVNALARLLAALLAGPRIKGSAGVKISQAHLEIYEKVDLPLAIQADASAHKDALYADYVASAIAARS